MFRIIPFASNDDNNYHNNNNNNNHNYSNKLLVAAVDTATATTAYISAPRAGTLEADCTSIWIAFDLFYRYFLRILQHFMFVLLFAVESAFFLNYNLVKFIIPSCL
jgi:hypothetical protein